MVLVTLLVLKKPALPSIFIASVSGGLVAVLFQGFTFSETLGFFYDGYTIKSGIEMVDSLLIRGGLTSMLALIVLFLFALGIGGMLADAGVLEVLIASFATKIKSTGVLDCDNSCLLCDTGNRRSHLLFNCDERNNDASDLRTIQPET